ncbi:hypothetical protein BCV73_12985 [Paenibacillus sp. SSG-1]|nr:hypothetical protein BCV73_12985 [Paenibacillus sp. SSG-1]
MIYVQLPGRRLRGDRPHAEHQVPRRTDEIGYVQVKPGTTETNIPGVFACGDVQDVRFRQAISAAGTVCMAAMDYEKFLEGSMVHDWSETL